MFVMRAYQQERASLTTPGVSLGIVVVAFESLSRRLLRNDGPDLAQLRCTLGFLISSPVASFAGNSTWATR